MTSSSNSNRVVRAVTFPSNHVTPLLIKLSQLNISTSRMAAVIAAVILLLLLGCNSVRHVPDGSFLLDKVSITVLDSTGNVNIDREQYLNYLRQQPNHKLLWKMKFQLGIYNLSGKDSTRWYNKLARNLGEAPVIYDSVLTLQSRTQLQRAMINEGYLHASVEIDTVGRPEKKKMSVEYIITPGPLYTISSVSYNIPNDTLHNLVIADTAALPVKPGVALNRDMLETQREYITRRLRNKGFYGFQKNYITYTADTTYGSSQVDLTMNIEAPRQALLQGALSPDVPFFVRRIFVVTDYNPAVMTSPEAYATYASDSVEYKGITIYYTDKQYLRPGVIAENCFISQDKPWTASSVDRTYEAFSRLGILNFVSIQSIPVVTLDNTEWLDVYVLLTPGKSQSVALELEGTNSEGDLGVAASVTYSHRNLGHGSETFTTKFRGAYESLSGNLDGFINNRYMEYSLDMGISFPKFKFPFLSENFKRKIRATTDLNLTLNYQERPEYTRVVANAGWAYRWTETRGMTRHVVTPIDLDYVYLPKSTINFIDDIAPNNPLLRYSYENHFIMRLGYSFFHTNKQRETVLSRYRPQTSIYSVRAKGEVAGNFLFLLSRICSGRLNFHEDPYKVFGIHYAQYVKLEGDYAYTHFFDQRNSLAFHAGLGIIVPYGNSAVAPFEKRFYGGGANGVRGWDVRTLGPGAYTATNSVANFMNQCGDIRMDMSVEYRAKLFWVIELGAFIDAGNIWTIHNYENQPGGMFHFNTFYKQIAAAYGIGVRLNFTYFLLRLDLGMKAHNPAFGQEQWPIIHPRWHRDSSIHFSVGYPF